MQTEDNYAPLRPSTEETVRVEPQAVMDRYDDERSETSSVSNEGNHDHTHENERDDNRHDAEPEESENHLVEGLEVDRDIDNERKEVKTENEDERWEYWGSWCKLDDSIKCDYIQLIWPGLWPETNVDIGFSQTQIVLKQYPIDETK